MTALGTQTAPSANVARQTFVLDAHARLAERMPAGAEREPVCLDVVAVPAIVLIVMDLCRTRTARMIRAYGSHFGLQLTATEWR